MATSNLTAQRLRELLHYNLDTGVFTWLVNAGSRARIGKVAGNKVKVTSGKVYWQIGIDGQAHYAHVLARLYVTGSWPLHEVDHEDGIGINNRFDNLRDATTSENQQNRKVAQSTSTTGLIGVGRYNDGRKKPFRALIKTDGKRKGLGFYATAEEAHEAYLLAKRQLHAGCTI
jgi:hypothetical protein